jgi:hypothetical protein
MLLVQLVIFLMGNTPNRTKHMYSCLNLQNIFKNEGME